MRSHDGTRHLSTARPAKPPRLSLLEYLYFAGDDRFGALGVSTSAAEYQPRRLGALSANVALKAAGETLGYPELAQLLRRRGAVEADRNVSWS